MEDHLGVVSCVISDPESVQEVNEMIHHYADSVIARMGVPCRDYGVNVISLVIHGTSNEISTFSGALGRIAGVKVKSIQISAAKRT